MNLIMNNVLNKKNKCVYLRQQWCPLVSISSVETGSLILEKNFIRKSFDIVKSIP